ncbi:DEKNAAC104801 [Brettanomyces naardenensis]|uniref:DEKNAAC104801 n=1 Tax=Brettanomyces naardenensis TaxID=13370 RepID=A0A448YRY8_BRENA|nr:DEKNAAC104801 [Brettanomyces naardenensis]
MDQPATTHEATDSSVSLMSVDKDNTIDIAEQQLQQPQIVQDPTGQMQAQPNAQTQNQAHAQTGDVHLQHPSVTESTKSLGNLYSFPTEQSIDQTYQSVNQSRQPAVQSPQTGVPQHPSSNVTALTTYHVTPVYKSLYSGVEVLEMEVNECPVMRRVKDSFFNATQILKLVGLDRSKRSKMLETEIYQGPHEKVQGGSGRYQGTWIPYDRAVSLSRRYDVYDVLKPLLLYNAAISETQTPTKAQLARTYSTMTEADENRESKPALTNGSGSPTKRIKFSQSDLPPLKTFDHDTRLPNPNSPFALPPVPESEVDEKSKVVLSSLFLPNQKDVTLLELVAGDESQLQGVNIDAPIDDNGQTALHLAATLGRVSLVKDLVQRGANRLRGDYDGQTALVRAVHATNCYENACFDKLLDYLYPVITVLDHKGRTVLHHIAYTCGRKGCSDACKYYLETLLEWVVKRGPTLPGNQALSLTKFMQDVVNIPDRNGDTCLNIAAMVGNKHIIQQLFEVGADPTKANKAGVRPTDCGVSIHWPNQESVGSGHQKQDSQSLHIAKPQKSISEGNGSLQILDSIQQFVARLGKDFQEEMDQKVRQINSLHPTLREKTLKLSEKRKQYEQLQKLVRTIADYKTKVANLDSAIEEEDQRFQEEAKALPLNSSNFSGNFDADEPFTVWSVFSEVERRVEQVVAERKQKKIESDGSSGSISDDNLDVVEILESINPDDLFEKIKDDLEDKRKSMNGTVELPPRAVLQARINAYKKNNQLLIERTKARRSSSQELEQQFKRVISLCIGSKPEEIDDKLLGSLLLSVENDPDPEIGQVKKVLEIVNDME